MEPIDAAKERFDTFVDQINTLGFWNSMDSEADVRMKVIDPLFSDILGWPKQDIKLECKAGPSFVDYCCTVKTLNRLVVEAKKEPRDLGINEGHAARFFKLSGAVFKTEAAREGIEQAIWYCGHKSAELACVTNGRQWAIFRGARGADGTDTLEGLACVFGSLEAIQSKFKEFYELLAHDAVEAYTYRAIFRQAEGQPIRQKSVKHPARDPASRRMIAAGKLSQDLDRVMQSFFRDLTGEQDAEARRACFVTTSESTAAERGLERISEDLRDKVKSLGTADTSELTEAIKRVKETKKDELVLLVGTKGAGKTTFIDRFFADVLPPKIRDDCVIVRIDLSKSGGDVEGVTKWLDEHFLEAAEKATFPNGPPTYDEIQGMFFGEYRRWSEGHAKYLYDTDKTQFKIDFGRHVEDIRQKRPHDYITHLLYRIVQAHQKIPCLVFDNADHFDVPFQQAVFNYAHSLCSEAICLVILPITDTTSWQLAKQGPLQSFYTDSFFLPTPPTELVLRRRIEYIEAKIAEQQELSGKKPEAGRGYFTERGIPLSIDNIKGFAATLQSVFVNTGSVADWVGRLANHDIRRCLQLTREIIISPHIHVSELLAAKLEHTTISVNSEDIKMAIVRGKYDIYDPTIQSFIQNLFNLIPEFETSPLLPSRILQFLEAAWEGHKDNDGRYVLVNEICEYFQSANIDARAARACLGSMLARGLILSYDPTATDIAKVTRVEIAPSGRQHLHWSLRDWVYIEAMAEITPLYDHAAAEAIKLSIAEDLPHLRRQALSTFLNYVLQEDAMFCTIPKHDIYKPQETIRTTLQQQVVALGSISAVAQTTRYRRLIGTTKGWKRDKGFGFIRQANGGDDAWVHISEILGNNPEFVSDGTTVEYDVIDEAPRPRATRVVILE
jgi:cold shock CspA family protein